ncbi:hypothetical protein LOAG_14715 [Loa loa]|uniref:Uncharacterized protein n=1 Tax=Loa loa TaxID=7209 RepID=A0A1S0TH92_LOALO|nr:hypothetical protein LOAG_14715 [Loa loa]EFO13813.1 hypothetical protein LOAG_14715 [Loa loa]
MYSNIEMLKTLKSSARNRAAAIKSAFFNSLRFRFQNQNSLKMSVIKIPPPSELKKLFGQPNIKTAEIPYDVLVCTRELCARYLGGAWNTISPEQLRMRPIMLFCNFIICYCTYVCMFVYKCSSSTKIKDQLNK